MLQQKIFVAQEISSYMFKRCLLKVLDADMLKVGNLGTYFPDILRENLDINKKPMLLIHKQIFSVYTQIIVLKWIPIVKSPMQPQCKVGVYVKMTLHPPTTTHTNSTSAISQQLLTRFWQNFKGRFQLSRWHATFVLVTFVHIRIISAGIDQILTKLLVPNFLGALFSFTNICFFTKLLLTQIFLDLYFFKPDFFYQICFDSIF